MDASVAAVSAFGAALAFVLSGIAFGLFLVRGVSSIWGPINDVFVAIAALLLVPPMLAVLDLAGAGVGGWFGVLTWLGIGGAVIMAAGQLLLVARLLSLQGSFVTGGIGVVPFLAWTLAHAVLVIGGGIALPAIVGWLAVGMLVASAALAVTYRSGDLVAWGTGVVLLALGAAWMVGLGAALSSIAGT